MVAYVSVVGWRLVDRIEGRDEAAADNHRPR